MTQLSSDPFDLARFVAAQASSYEQALAELRARRKRSHWSWFIIPQIRGLGASSMSVRYGIGSLEEAKAYLAHPRLGPRLRECVAAMNSHATLSASQLLGAIDAMKFRSCLTLFAEASDHQPLFSQALARYFDGTPDEKTLSILAAQRRGD
jgi:uncharacterized protein (DUF1810 family)